MKAIITDLDRTLLRTDKTVSEYTCTILKKCHERGIVLMAATARPERAILSYRNQIGFDAITTLNGARVILPHSIIENGILPSSAASIVKKVIRIPDLVLALETGKGVFSNIPIPEENATVFSEFASLPTGNIIYKLLVSSKKININKDTDTNKNINVYKETNIYREVKEALTRDTYMTVAEGKLIQIMSTASTKWNGIRTMMEAMGMKQDDAIYFGDDNDDIESIKNCGVGVAVSNAIDEVLDAADFRTESNDMDGVARYIEENLL